MMKPTMILVATAALCGCVAETSLSVVPGQGKTSADLQRDDATCRGAAPATTTQAAAATAPDYYRCMAAHGELVVPNRTAAYPAYAAYPYPYPYPYAYPAYAYPYAYGYPSFGYGYPYVGYPYSAAYVGIGFGFGGYRGYGGYRGGYGGFHGGEHGGFHGGGRR